jgi:hypothetical protein
VSIEDLFDFDTLLEQLGVARNRSRTPDADRHRRPRPSTLDKVVPFTNDTDPFAMLERHLRESEGERLRIRRPRPTGA